MTKVWVWGRASNRSRSRNSNSNSNGGRALLDNPPFAMGLQRMGHPVSWRDERRGQYGDISKQWLGGFGRICACNLIPRRMTMKKQFVAALGALLVAMPAMSQSVFNGTWKVDMNKVDFSKKPDVLVLMNGTYECKTCTPPYKIKADGTDQAVTGHPYVDTIAVKVVNDHQIQETDKKGGKVVSTSTTTISADGKTSMFTFTDSSNTNGGAPVTG